MARIELPIVVLNDEAPYNPVNGATAVIAFRGGGSADVYKDSGATNDKVTQPLSTDKAGRLTGWLERGAYEVTITIPGKVPYSEFIDAAPASDKSVTTTWIADNAVTASQILNGTITDSEIASANKDGVAGTASLRTLGAGAQQATAGNDARLSDQRTPLNESVTEEKVSDTFLDKLGVSDSEVSRRGKSIISGESTVVSTTYKTLSAPDLVTVTMPTDGLMFIAYQAMWKYSTGGESAAIFIDGNQLKHAEFGQASPTLAQEGKSGNNVNTWYPLSTCARGLTFQVPNSTTAYTGDVTTGQLVGIRTSYSDPNFDPVYVGGGPCIIFAAAGNHSVSIQFKATSGSVTAKERKLWVWTMGF